MKTTFTGLLLIAFLVILAVPATGQRHQKQQPVYDPTTEITLETVVDEVTQHRCGQNWSGTHLMVTLGGKPVEVHLGPAAFIREQAIKFKPGDKITITGSRVMTEAGDAIVARQVDIGEQRLVLRDLDGKPTWPASRWSW
jgi:hypothetical protein